MHESLAINLYLAKRHGGPLAPASLQEEALATMWTLWGAAECEPAAVRVISHLRMLPEAQRNPDKANAAIAALGKPFDLLELHLAESGGHLVGGRFTVADVNLAEILRYAQPAEELFATHPRIAAWIDSCQARPVFREMMAEREAEPA